MIEHEFYITQSLETPDLEIKKPSSEPIDKTEMPDLADFSFFLQDDAVKDVKKKEPEKKDVSLFEKEDVIHEKSAEMPLGATVGNELLEEETTEKKEGEILEDDFVTLEAQNAYYDFMFALENLDGETGEGVENFLIAGKQLEKHFEEMSLPKLFSVVVAMMGKLMELWGVEKEREAEKMYSETSLQDTIKGGEIEENDTTEPELIAIRERSELVTQAPHFSPKLPIAA